MGRAIVSDQSFFGSLAACLLIMLLHRLVAWVTYQSHPAGKILKGNPILLVKDGVQQIHNMRRTHVTKEDVHEALHQSANLSDIKDIKEAYLERSGEISIVKR